MQHFHYCLTEFQEEYLLCGLETLMNGSGMTEIADGGQTVPTQHLDSVFPPSEPFFICLVGLYTVELTHK